MTGWRRSNARLVVPRGSERHELRISGMGALVDGLRTGLISPRAKFELRHLARDALKVRKQMSYTDHSARASVDRESVGDYCRRRFGRETHDWAIDPLTRGLWVVDADPISSVDLFFALVKMFGPGMLRYPAGMDFLCRELAGRLDVRLECPVGSVERVGDGARVTWQKDGTQQSEEVAACVLAVVAPAVPEIHHGLDDRIAEILADELQYTNTITASFALSRRPAGDQLATVIPEQVDAGLAIVPFTHVSCPDCAPPGKGLIAGYWTSEWSTAHFDLDDDALLAEMLPSMDRIVPGIESMTEFVNVERWRLSTLKSRPGLHRTIAELTDRLDPADPIQLAGDYFGPPNLESCVLSAEIAARNVDSQYRVRELAA